MSNLGRRAFTSVLVGYAGVSAAQATENLPAPNGKSILSISGQITQTNAGSEANFDKVMLEALTQDSFRTTTPWYDGPVKFEGVQMSRLMQTVGAKGQTVVAVALNDYTTELPISDFERYGVLLALKRDDIYMPIRDKGPLFIVYPFDSAAELRSQQYYSRSAWQVAKLIVK